MALPLRYPFFNRANREIKGVLTKGAPRGRDSAWPRMGLARSSGAVGRAVFKVFAPSVQRAGKARGLWGAG